MKRSSSLALLFFLAGLGYLSLTPPFQVPDEINHFLRVYQITQGQLLGERNRARVGGTVPEVMLKDVSAFSDIQGHSQRSLSLKDFRSRVKAGRPLDNTALKHQVFTDFPTMVLYCPLAYLPQVVGVKLALFFSMSTFQALYVGRLFTLIFCACALFLALFLLRDQSLAQLLLWLLAGTPMCLFEMASVSADAVTDSLALVCAGAAIALTRSSRNWVFTVFLLAAMGLSLCKTVYIFLPLGMALSLWPREKKRLGLLLVAAFSPAFLWSLASKGYYRPVRGDVGKQVQFIREYFPGSLRPLLAISRQRWVIADYVGGLGWLDGKVSSHFSDFYLWVVMIASLCLPKRVSIKENLWTLFLCALTVGLVILSQYLYWTPVGASEVEGVQGRYFIPVGFFFFFSLQFFPTSRNGLCERVLTWGLPLMWIGCQFAGLQVLFHRYWQ